MNPRDTVGIRGLVDVPVPHELLAEPDVKDDDGSRTEWGNMVNVPIERG